jgi:hypothetical protein
MFYSYDTRKFFGVERYASYFENEICLNNARRFCRDLKETSIHNFNSISYMARYNGEQLGVLNKQSETVLSAYF